MYLLLKTYVNADLEDAHMTRCAVLDVSTESLDYWQGLMEQAAWVSTKLGKETTLAFMDYTPAYYQGLPDSDEEDGGEEYDLDPGWCLLEAPPFPESEETGNPDAWNEPVRLSYSELRVSATELQWFYGPKFGSVEEYTAYLSPEDLDAIRQALTTPTTQGASHA